MLSMHTSPVHYDNSTHDIHHASSLHFHVVFHPLIDRCPLRLVALVMLLLLQKGKRTSGHDRLENATVQQVVPFSDNVSFMKAITVHLLFSP